MRSLPVTSTHDQAVGSDHEPRPSDLDVNALSTLAHACSHKVIWREEGEQ